MLGLHCSTFVALGYKSGLLQSHLDTRSISAFSQGDIMQHRIKAKLQLRGLENLPGG